MEIPEAFGYVRSKDKTFAVKRKVIRHESEFTGKDGGHLRFIEFEQVSKVAKWRRWR